MGVLLYSTYMIYNSLSSYKEGHVENFYIGIIVGVMGIGLAVSSLTTLRKRLFMLKAMDKRVVTVERCNKCSFKKIRTFEKGDYINKRIGKCSQCKGDIFIAAIYLEDKEGTSQKVITSHPSSLTKTVCSA